MKTWLSKIDGGEFKVMKLQDAPQGEIGGDTPEAIVNYIRQMIPGSLRYSPETENLMLVALSSRRHIIGFQVISNGTLDTLLVHAREVFRPAIVMNASAVVIAHNHPSGDPTPSAADIKVTRDLITASSTRKADGWAPTLEYSNGGRVIGQQRYGTMAEAVSDSAEMIECIADHPSAFQHNHPEVNQVIDLGNGGAS